MIGMQANPTPSHFQLHGHVHEKRPKKIISNQLNLCVEVWDSKVLTCVVYRKSKIKMELIVIELNGVKECGWLHVNPCLHVSKFNEGPSRNGLLTPEEMDRFLDACRKSKSKALYPMIFLAMRSGMRLANYKSLISVMFI